MGAPEIPKERQTAQQRVSLPQTPTETELEIKQLLTAQAAFKSSHGEFGHRCFQIAIQRNRGNFKLLFSYFSE